MRKLIIASALLSLIAVPVTAGQFYRTWADKTKPCISTNLGTWCSEYGFPIVSDTLWDYCESIGGEQQIYDEDSNPSPYCLDVRMDNGQIVNILRGKH